MAVFFRIKLVNGMLAINFKIACFSKTIYLSRECDGLKIIVGAKNFKIYKKIEGYEKLKSLNLSETTTLFTINKDSIAGEISFLIDNNSFSLNDYNNHSTIMYFTLFKNSGVRFLKKTTRKQHISNRNVEIECNLKFALKAHLLSIFSSILKILFTRRKTNGSKLQYKF